MVRELKWNFEEWFEHNKKLMQDFKERMLEKDNEQQPTENNNNKGEKTMAKYYVYNNLKGKPYHIHTSYEEALAEAKRLALKENLVFEVLKIKSSVVPEMSISVIEEKDHIVDANKKVESEGNNVML